MTSRSGGSGERQWLAEPPGPQEISFQISAGDQVEVTPEVQQAFENLLQTLRGGDVQGYAYDPNCPSKNFMCQPNYRCRVETQAPCLIDYHCQIGKAV